MKGHISSFRPINDILQVFLEELDLIAMDMQVSSGKHRIIECKVHDTMFDIINKNQEKDWLQNCTLWNPAIYQCNDG